MLRKGELRLISLIVGGILMAALAIGYAVGLAVQPRVAVAPSEVRPPVDFAVSEAATRDPIGLRSDGVPLAGYTDVYLNDYANLLGPEAETRLRAKMVRVYDATGIEMTVLTIARRADYGFDGSNEAFATGVFNDWGIGNAERNDGVLVLVSHLDREMRVELGAGYGTEYNIAMRRVIDDYFLPHFRRDAYEWGIEHGVDETVRALTGLYPDDLERGTLSRGWAWIWRSLWGLGEAALAVLALPGLAVAFGLRWYRRVRPRDCHACGAAMRRQGEDVDDTHLDGGQRLEEYVRSVDYDVWECPDCAAMQVTRHPAWMSKYGTCPHCNYRTLRSETEVLEHATTQKTGRKRIDYQCEHCDHRDSEVRTIPKRSKSSSGSGSGRSSFGGGRSSGGGASGSW
ncbi:MAG: TPM domain-containing protein [Pseudomonadota bacterium]